MEDRVEPVMSLHPLASALDKEFHILKFYEFSTALVSSILQVSATFNWLCLGDIFVKLAIYFICYYCYCIHVLLFFST